MKQICIVLCFILFGSLCLRSQNIHIPDQCFINALVENGVDSKGDGLIRAQEAEVVEQLSFCSECITDLKGIEAFVNLTHLSCNTKILRGFDLSSITKLCRLVISGQFDTLDLSHNPLVDTLNLFRGTDQLPGCVYQHQPVGTLGRIQPVHTPGYFQKHQPCASLH